MSIVFIGDIHQQWHFVEQGLAALPDPPRAAILLGDIQCDRPLDELAAPLLDRGIAVHWIFGNHDADGGPEMWENLVDPARNPRTASGALHGRVVEIAGVRIAGLGGTFRPRVWNPPFPARVHRRAHLADDLAEQGHAFRDHHVEALVQSLSTLAIWPEDYEALAAQQADILVTHEGPGSHPAGNAALDELARAMGAWLVVHGHHHLGYRAEAPDGLGVLGVASAAGVTVGGEVLWVGDKERPIRGGFGEGWVVVGVG
ncbi:MAG: metallophosphoesterase [Acetobacteraceae bacterium]